jgi:GTPase SAR1 family protein
VKITRKEWNSLQVLDNKDILFVVGLPGSGKSTLFKSYYKATHNILDSFLTSPDYFDRITTWVNKGKKCVVTDIMLCDGMFLNNLITKTKNSFQGIKIGVIYFENNPHKCAQNIIKRSLERGDEYITLNNKRIMVGSIKNLKPQWELEIKKLFRIYPNYIIPSSSTTLEIQCT